MKSVRAGARGATGLALLLVLGLAACGDGSTTTAGTTTTGGAAATSTTSAGGSGSTTTTAEPLAGAGTDPVSGDGVGTGAGLLTNVELGHHDGYDRIVFTFAGDTVPGYLVQYVDPPIIADGSGATVDVAGSAFLSVRMEPASGFDQSTGQPTYTGSLDITGASAGTTQMQEAVQTGDFEAVLNWAIGLGDKVDFSVDVLSSPARLVIDVRN